MGKKKILLVWWEVDHRPEFLQPFINISNEFEFIHLIYKNKKERTTNSSPFKMIYWYDYVNAQAIIKDIKPAVIIGVTEGVFTAALIKASKDFNLPYYGLQHGYTPENIGDILLYRKRVIDFEKIRGYFRSTFFFLFSFSLLRPATFCSAVKFYFLNLKMNGIKVLEDFKFSWLTPDYYICFSEYSSEHYKRMYLLPDDKIKFTGILWFDRLFQKAEVLSHQIRAGNEKYYLLIDTTFDEYSKPVSEEQINRCYIELSAFCEQHGARLKVKLHPWNYEHTYLVQHPNIDYIRKTEDEVLYALIADCEGCFGFYSTLTFPVLAIKPVIQIDYDGIYLKLAEEKGLTPVIDFYTFTKDDIHFPGKEMLDLHKDDVQYLLYKTDGRATERLKQILLSA